MATERKRPGPRPRGEFKDKRKTLKTRITEATRRQLDEACAASGRSLAQEVERRIERSFRDDAVMRAIGALQRRIEALAVGMETISGAKRNDEPTDSVRVRVLPDGRITRADAARYLGVSIKTLAQWQTQGRGPKSIRVGGRRFHLKTDLDAFIVTTSA